MFSKTFALLVTAILPVALAAPSVAAPAGNATAQADFWAQFCDDTDCQTNCGQSVEVSNPGCLGQVGRGSVRFHGAPDKDYRIVVSNGPDCPCQVECATIPRDTECWDISLYQDAQSFRFQSDGCAANNC